MRFSVPPLLPRLAALLRPAPARAPAQARPEPPTFEKHVLAIFQARCLSCHGDKKQRAGLDLRTRAAILQGGETGPAIVPGPGKSSLLWEKISRDHMPPDKDKLTAAEKAAVLAWIEGGAKALE